MCEEPKQVYVFDDNSNKPMSLNVYKLSTFKQKSNRNESFFIISYELDLGGCFYYTLKKKKKKIKIYLKINKILEWSFEAFMKIFGFVYYFFTAAFLISTCWHWWVLLIQSNCINLLWNNKPKVNFNIELLDFI